MSVDKKEITLDLTPLSVGQQCDVIRAVAGLLEKSAKGIREDLQSYTPGGEAYKDMAGWAQAAEALRHSLLTQAKDAQITFYL